MASIASVLIASHTTSSEPWPHVQYVIKVVRDDGSSYEILRRYSEFVALKEVLGGARRLPPKRALTTSMMPLAWVSDELIKERISGLQAYLADLLHDATRCDCSELLQFLAPPAGGRADTVDMVSRNTVIVTQGAVFASTQRTEPDTSKFIAGSYYPSWCMETHPPSKIDFSKFDVIFYAFVIPNGVSGIDWDNGSQQTLKSLVSAARKNDHGTKIVLSVGGWSGSHWFSHVMSSDATRGKLIKCLEETIKTYDLDGIDIDWEYPGAPGAGNPHSPLDAQNLLMFFQALRGCIGQDKIISSAVTQTPWLGENGSPLTDVAEFAKYMTYVNIMNYDVYDSSVHPGPNAPLGNLCSTSKQPQASAEAAFAQWTKAGMPASKLLLGLPLYGYVSKSTDKKLTGSAIPAPSDPRPPFVAHWHRPSTPFHAPLGDLSSLWGQQIAFNRLVSSGALRKNQDGNYDASNGYTMGWDDCSDTPYIFDISRTTVVTYDDTFSIGSKTKFARSSGMGGCFTWSMDQDDDMCLHKVVLRAMGRLAP